ncbi:hypothetical protein GQX74_006405 [Glossina fuscipes]|nr:hypothetical protein GQX74_006405 [Glossina fuscipes]
MPTTNTGLFLYRLSPWSTALSCILPADELVSIFMFPIPVFGSFDDIAFEFNTFPSVAPVDPKTVVVVVVALTLPPVQATRFRRGLMPRAPGSFKLMLTLTDVCGGGGGKVIRLDVVCCCCCCCCCPAETDDNCKPPELLLLLAVLFVVVVAIVIWVAPDPLVIVVVDALLDGTAVNACVVTCGFIVVRAFVKPYCGLPSKPLAAATEVGICIFVPGMVMDAVSLITAAPPSQNLAASVTAKLTSLGSRDDSPDYNRFGYTVSLLPVDSPAFYLKRQEKYDNSQGAGTS